MTVSDLLNGICREDSGGIYRFSVEISPLQFRHKNPSQFVRENEHANRPSTAFSIGSRGYAASM